MQQPYKHRISITPYTKKGRRPKDDPVDKELRETLEHNINKIFKQYIHLRDHGRCVLTGGRRNVTLSHYFGVSCCPALKWNENNVWLMVRSKHDLFHNGNPEQYRDYLIQKIGIDEFEKMKKLSKRDSYYYSVDNLMKLIETYTRKYEVLKGQKQKEEA